MLHLPKKANPNLRPNHNLDYETNSGNPEESKCLKPSWEKIMPARRCPVAKISPDVQCLVELLRDLVKLWESTTPLHM